MTDRVHHEIVVKKADLIAGEDTYACTLCNEQIALVWDGESFSLTEADAADINFGTVGITFE